MNKALFDYCQRNLRFASQGKLKANASLKRLHRDYCFGVIKGGFCHFTDNDKQSLIGRVQDELNGIHIFRDSYPDAQPRDTKAKVDRNEKKGALSVSEDFVLLNSLSELSINQQLIPQSSLRSLGQFICASEVKTIEHKYIILVENLIVMANLSRLNIPDALKGALWLYRGDIQAHKNTGTAYAFFRRFKDSNQLICFADVDPSGLQIALTSGAQQLLSIEDEQELSIALTGFEQEWFKQTEAITYLKCREDLPQRCGLLFKQMQETQKTLKQEHIIAHSLALGLSPLTIL